MLDIDFIQNLSYVLQNKDAFLDYLEDDFLIILVTILFSLFIGWLTRKVWKKRKSIIIPFAIFMIPLIFLLIFGVSLGRLTPINALWLVYILIVPVFWTFCWSKNKTKKGRKPLGFGVFLLSGMILILLLLGILAGFFVSSRSNPAMDSKIISLMSQLRSKTGLIVLTEGNYSKLRCKYDRETKIICNEVDKLCISIREDCNGDDSKGGEQDLIIHSTQKNYCAYTPLPDSDNWYCTDSTGVAREVNVNPGNGYCTENSFNCPPRTE